MARWTKKLTRREKDILAISARIKHYEQTIELNRKLIGKPNNCGVVVNTQDWFDRFEASMRQTIEGEQKRISRLEADAK